MAIARFGIIRILQNRNGRQFVRRRRMPNMAEKLSYTIEEAAKVTGIGRSRLYVEIGKRRLRMVKCGRRSTILYDDLRAWLASLPSSDDNNAA